jgi:hypothetical protein
MGTAAESCDALLQHQGTFDALLSLTIAYEHGEWTVVGDRGRVWAYPATPSLPRISTRWPGPRRRSTSVCEHRDRAVGLLTDHAEVSVSPVVNPSS